MNWMRVLIVLIAFPSVPVWANQADVLRDAELAFTREVGKVAIDALYREKLMHQTEDLIRRNPLEFDSSQFFLLVDRNHTKQEAFLAFYDATEEKVILIGADSVSTGNPRRRGYFETPIGIFENKPANMDYRALGTKNKLGWRGLGTKGSRVWDLGWQHTVKQCGEPMVIRMLVHATDPDFGEQRLGTVQSKGCIRITARLNKFLDYYGVLDQEYELDVRARYVLLAKRNPLPFAGRFVVVVDSGETQEPAKT